MNNWKHFPGLILSPVFILAWALMIPAGCSKKEESPEVLPSKPVLTTASVTQITQTTAASGGDITSDGGATVTARGICWSRSDPPTLNDTLTTNGSGAGAFVSQLTSLQPGKVYFVRAYATNSAGTGYGNTLSFTTLAIPEDTVTDIDGNSYHIVVIGSQKWLKENLRVTRYRTGDAIPEVKPDAQWKILTNGARAIYDHNGTNLPVYRFLYNFFAVNDSRGICPEGWHVATDDEWKTLGAFLGGLASAGGKMKSTGTIEQGTGLWYAPNAEADNSSGFTGLPGGYRINYGTFYSIGNVGMFWTSTDTASVNAWNYILDANNGLLKRNFNLLQNGFSVRCCKD